MLLFLHTSQIFAQQQSIEQGWKNIKVFQTKRADVEKRFGMPTTPDEGHMVYRTPDGNVVIVYSEGPCSNATFARGIYSLEKDTVIEYNVYLKKPWPLSELTWKKEDYGRVKSSHFPDLYHYNNTAGDVWITTRITDGTEMIQSFWFRPTSEQTKRFRCKEPTKEISIEGGWRNIKIFQTKRVEVEKMLGKPGQDVGKVHTIYPGSDAHVAVVYSDAPCNSTTADKGDYNLELGTVIDYKVHLKKPFPLSQLKWKKDHYDGGPDLHRRDVFSYYNSKDGVWITTEIVDGTEMVLSFWFMSTDEQKERFRCKEPTKEVPIECGWKNLN